MEKPLEENLGELGGTLRNAEELWEIWRNLRKLDIPHISTRVGEYQRAEEAEPWIVVRLG
jgi:hypothetical protein